MDDKDETTGPESSSDDSTNEEQVEETLDTTMMDIELNKADFARDDDDDAGQSGDDASEESIEDMLKKHKSLSHRVKGLFKKK